MRKLFSLKGTEIRFSHLLHLKVLVTAPVYRSEIHETMNCIRCENSDVDRPELEKRDVNQLMHGSCQSGQDTSDIGGFAEISGCLDKLKSSEKQVSNIHPISYDSSQLPCYTKADIFLFKNSGRDTSGRRFR